MKKHVSRIRRLLNFVEDYRMYRKLGDSTLNGRDRALVRRASRSGDAESHLRSHCRRSDNIPNLIKRIASLETWNLSLAAIARSLGVAKSVASRLLAESKRLTAGSYKECQREPSVTVAAIWVGRFVRFAGIEFSSMAAPTEEPGELTSDLLSASLERNALLEFEQRFAKIESDCAQAGLGGQEFRSACEGQIQEFYNFLNRVPPAFGKDNLRYGLLELVVPSDRQLQTEFEVKQAITKTLGVHSLRIVDQSFSRSLVQMMASVPSDLASTGFFPDIRHTVLPELLTIRAGVASYHVTGPDIPRYGIKPRCEIRKESKGRLYSSPVRPSELAPLLPQATAEIVPEAGDLMIDTTDSWQSLFVALTSEEFAASVVATGRVQLEKALKLEDGMYSLIPWTMMPARVREDLLAGACGKAELELLACGLALLQFSPRFVLEGGSATIDPLVVSWSEQITTKLNAISENELLLPLAGKNERKAFVRSFAESLLVEHMTEIRDAFVAAIEAELPRLGTFLFKPTALLAENSALRTFWPPSFGFTEERILSEFEVFLALSGNGPKRLRCVSMDRKYGDDENGSPLLDSLSNEADLDWEVVAENFRARLAKREEALKGEVATRAAIQIAQMLQETGKDNVRFIGLLSKKMSREVSQAISH